MSEYILFLLLFGLPFIYLPWITLSFEPPKVFIFQFLVQILLISKLWKERLDWMRYHKIQLVIMAILVLLTIFHLILYSPQLGFFGNIFRMQGVLFFWHLVLFAFVSSSLRVKKVPKLIYIAVFILLLFFTLVIGANRSGRWMGTLGEPNALAATVVFITAFSLLEQNKIFKIAIWIVACILVLLSGSKSGMIALFIQFLFIVLAYDFKINLKKALIVCFIFIALSYALPFIEKGGVFENRAEIWLTSAKAVLKSPLYGAGFGNTEKAIKDTAETLKNNLRYQYVDSSHNIFLDWLIQGGVISFLLLIVLLSQTFKSLIQTKQKHLIVALLGVFTTASFNPLSVTSLVAFWWLIGQGLLETHENLRI